METVVKEYVARDDVKNLLAKTFDTFKADLVDPCSVLELLDDVESSDVVPVVRCKDYNYYHLMEEGYHDCINPLGLDTPNTHHFCPHGDRKNEPGTYNKWLIGDGDDNFDVKCPVCGYSEIFGVCGLMVVRDIAKQMHYCQNCGERLEV